MQVDKVKQQFLAARRFGVPLLGIETPDMAATITRCVQAINGDAPPLFSWDVVSGLRCQNKRAEQACVKLNVRPEVLSEETGNPVEMLRWVLKLEAESTIFMLNAHLFYCAEGTVQAIWNLRDAFKATRRMLVLLGPTIKLPAELERDVLVIDEPLPDDGELEQIAQTMYDLIGTTSKFPKGMREETVRASRGLSAFAAEQAIAMSLTKSGIDTQTLWEHKRHMIEQTKGLRVYTGGATFADIGGIDRIKEFGTRLFEGNNPPSVVVWVDEIEKAMAGSSGQGTDTSGTSQDQLGQLLTEMQQNEWAGLIALGPPGCAKSLFAQSLGTTHGVPCVQLDLGAMKGSLVGQSEQQIREAMKVIKAIAGKSAYWIATCNRMESLPPELRRRFTDGIYFFDLPDKAERESIWATLLRKYGLKPKPSEMPFDENWTGADIRNVCSIASRLKCSLIEAATYITPVFKSNPEAIERLRMLAHDSFLSASHAGLYQRNNPDAVRHMGRVLG